ncbi:MAG: PilX N-terminal domain-containing pilus assembly protein [Pseudohongiellaceae bacterium]
MKCVVMSGNPGRQRGAVLIFCLVFLLVLTLMGVSSMESTILEERMAGNMQDYSAAFQAAESALTEGEQWLAGQAIWPTASDDGSTGVWVREAMDPDADNSVPWWRETSRNTSSWWQNNARVAPGAPGLAENPRFVIEEYRVATSGESVALGTGSQDRSRVFHRITARGTGRNASSVVQLQSTYVRSYE